MLTKQKFYVPLTEGLNNKKDDRFLIPGEVKALENGVYRKEGRIDKKLGFSNLTKNIFGGGTLSEAAGIYSLDDQLLCEDSGHLYAYSENSDAWIDKGVFVRTSAETQTIIRNNEEQYDPQYATIGNFRLFVWYDTELKYSVQDILTGVYYVHDQTFAPSSAYKRPTVVALGTTFYLFSWNGNSSVFYHTVSTSTPTVISSITTLLNAVVEPSGCIYTAAAVGSDIFVAYHSPTGANDTLVTNKYAGGNLAVVSATDAYSAATQMYDGANEYALHIATSTVSGTTYLHVAWHNNTARTNVRILDTNLSVILANAAFTNVISPLGTGVQESTSSHVVRWFGSDIITPGSVDLNNAVYTGSIGPSGVVEEATVFPQFMRVATQAFRIDNRAMIGVVITPADQRAIYIVDSDFNIITKLAAGEAGKSTNGRYLPQVEVSGTEVTIGFAQQGEYKVEDSVGYSVEGFALARVQFGPQASCSVAKANGVLYFSSGILKVYDGISVFEDGFATYPVVTVNALVVAGDIEPGDYQWTATYEWLDNKGNLHRSAPAIPFAATLGTDQEMTINFSQLTLTERTVSNRADVKVVIWRTDNSGAAPFYRVAEVNNSAGGPYIDNSPDEDIISNEILYTTGGVLENIQAPASTAITNHKNHLVLSGMEDPEVIRSSKPAFRHEAPGFNEGLEVRTASEGGRNVTVASMDDKLIIFKENATYFCVGDGPDVFGGGMFTSPQLVSDTIGCPYKNSVVLTTDGLMFQSSQGIYLLTRGLELVPIGDSVEDYTDSEIVNVVKIKDQNEVRFCQANGDMLVYNFDFKRWSVFTDKDCVGSTIWQDKHVIVDSAGQVSYEDDTTYLDNASFVPLKAITGWIQIDEIAGLQRIYKVQVVGEYLTPHKVTLDISYDNDDSLVETHQLNISANPKEYLYECRPRRQKCSSIQFTLRDAAPTSSTGTGQGMAISGLRLVCGVKSRLSNVPNTRRI